MTAKKEQNFEMWSGDHRNLIYTVSDATSASVDLAGASVMWVMADDSLSGSILRLTNESGSGVSVSAASSQFTVSLSPAHTADLAGTYFYEAEIIDSNNNRVTVAVGTATINQDISGG
jgi:hypothetical protein